MAPALINLKVFVLSVAFALFAFILNQKWDVTQLDLLLFHPERAHYSNTHFINSKSSRLFEGWYYKIASSDIQFGVIPGAYHSTNENGDYAFIYLATPDFVYEYRYPLDQYLTDKGAVNTEQQFYINIGPNNFSRDSMSLYLEPEYIHSIQPTNYPNHSEPIKMNLTFFDQFDGFPVSLLNLGATGYYGYIPFLECYHGILSMNYLIDGTIELWNNVIYDEHSPIAHGYLVYTK